jgi:hypothetical protein
LFDALEVKQGDAPKAKKAGDIPTIGVNKKTMITPEQLQAISDKAETIRTKIIK